MKDVSSIIRTSWRQVSQKFLWKRAPGGFLFIATGLICWRLWSPSSSRTSTSQRLRCKLGPCLSHCAVEVQGHHHIKEIKLPLGWTAVNHMEVRLFPLPFPLLPTHTPSLRLKRWMEMWQNKLYQGGCQPQGEDFKEKPFSSHTQQYHKGSTTPRIGRMQFIDSYSLNNATPTTATTPHGCFSDLHIDAHKSHSSPSTYSYGPVPPFVG